MALSQVLLRDEPEFALREESRSSPWLWMVAVALHVPLLFIVVRHEIRVEHPPIDQRTVVIAQPMPAFASPFLRGVRVLLPQHAPVVKSVPLVQLPPMKAAPVQTAVAPTVGAAPIPMVVTDSPPRRSSSDLLPHYGDGRLWVQPMAESPREIARALSGKSAQQLTDSAVASMVQAYLDAMAREAAANPTALPSWTTKIAGKTVGLDSKWIYLGPIKIPTMLLALLPINMNGNMSNYQYNKQLESMRSDLFEAARRAANYDDFKKAVKDLHEQTERAREFKKNQRTPPDTSHRG